MEDLVSLAHLRYTIEQFHKKIKHVLEADELNVVLDACSTITLK